MDTDPDAVRLPGLAPDECCVAGLKQAEKALSGGRARRVYAAQDSDSKVSERIQELLATPNIDVDYSFTRKQLGGFCGLGVGASIVVVLEK